jgi:hypothetical protein
MIPENSADFSASYLSENRVTGCICMKTIIKPRKPFFPSGIMELGALASSGYAACGDTPIYSCAGLLRPRLVSTLPFAAPQIYDNCSLTTEYIDTSPAGRRSHAGGRAFGLSPGILAAARAIRRPWYTAHGVEDEPNRGLRG